MPTPGEENGAAYSLHARGEPFSGEHCETVALGTLLAAEGLDFSEADLFLLGRGLGFFLAKDAGMCMPMFAGRIMPGKLSEHVLAALGLEFSAFEPDPQSAPDELRAALRAGKPAMVQLDCFYLDYFRTPIHFAGHFVAVLEIAGDAVTLVDTQSQGGLCRTSWDGFCKGWAADGYLARPWFGGTLAGCARALSQEDWQRALRETASAYLEHPRGGARALAEAVEALPQWLAADQAQADAARSAKLMERGGTGGANFRRLFAEAVARHGSAMQAAHWERVETSWREFSAAFFEFSENPSATCRDKACALLGSLAQAEREGMELFL